MASFSVISAFRVVPELKQQLAPYDAFWNRMREHEISRKYGTIQHIDFSHSTDPSNNRRFVITRSTNVEVIDQDSLEVIKRYKMFKESAYGAVYRQDGRLIAVGGEEKFVRLIETSSDSVLRILNGHSDAVHAVSFLADRRTVLSCGDDASVRLWDIAGSAQIFSSASGEFKDYVRCCATSKSDENLFFAGSYDHSCRLFDRRTTAKSIKIDCGQPVESVLLYPNDKLAVVAAGSSVIVYDLVAGGKKLTQISTAHHKTITSLCMLQDGTQFLTASIDRHVKVINATDFNVVHDLHQASPALSLGISDDAQLLAIGCADGVLKMYKPPVTINESKRERQAFQAEPSAVKRRLIRPLLHERFYAPNHSSQLDDDDADADESAEPKNLVTIPDDTGFSRPVKGGQAEMHLKRFNAAKAFDAVINRDYWRRNPGKTVTTILELSRRGSLRNVLRSCSDYQLKSLLHFLNTFATDPQYSAYLLRLIEMLLEERPALLGHNPKVDHIFMKLCEQVERETTHAKHLVEARGLVDALLGTSRNVMGGSENLEGKSSKRKKMDAGVSKPSSVGDATHTTLPNADDEEFASSKSSSNRKQQ